MILREIDRCDCGWIAEEVVREDAIVSVFDGDETLVFEIRCKTWERAREWVDAMRSRGFKTRIRWEAV